MANSVEDKDTDIDFKKLVTTVAMENFINSTYVRGTHPALNKAHLANGLYNLINNTDIAEEEHINDIFATDNDIDAAFSNN